MRMTTKQYHELTNKPKAENKYHAKTCVVDGFRFHSIAEADYYRVLLHRKRIGVISYFLRQVPFHLPGGVKIIVDFMVVNKGGAINFVDVKGCKPTEAWRAKQRIAEALYNITIYIIKKTQIKHMKYQCGLS